MSTKEWKKDTKTLDVIQVTNMDAWRQRLEVNFLQ